MCDLESEGEEGYDEVTTYSTLHLGACAGRAGQASAGREDMSSLLEKSEEGSPCYTRASCPSLHADVKPSTEAAPGHSRGLAVFVQ